MFGDAFEPFYVFLDQLGCAVVVVHDAAHAVGDGVVGLAETDVDGEEGVDEDEEEGVELVLEELAHADYAFFSLWSS